jgi:hypothetical protein
MKEITRVSGGCADQARITIRFDLKGKLKKLVEAFTGEGFSLSIDDQGDMAGKLEGELRGDLENAGTIEDRRFQILKIKELSNVTGKKQNRRNY